MSFCDPRLCYAQSYSDVSHVHASAPSSALHVLSLRLTPIHLCSILPSLGRMVSGPSEAVAEWSGHGTRGWCTCQCRRCGVKHRTNLFCARRACVARGVWGHAPPWKFDNFSTPEVLSEAISEVFIYAASCWQISVHQVVTRGLKFWEDSKVSESLLTHCC